MLETIESFAEALILTWWYGFLIFYGLIIAEACYETIYGRFIYKYIQPGYWFIVIPLLCLIWPFFAYCKVLEFFGKTPPKY